MRHRLSFRWWLIGQSRCTCGGCRPCLGEFREVARDVEAEQQMIDWQRDVLRAEHGWIEQGRAG